MTFGEYIRKLREQKDVSLREVAKRIDCSAAFVSDIELGRRFPSEEMLVRIAKVLGVTIEKLRAHDTRPPVQEIRRLTEQNPEYAFAFRKLIDTKIQPEDLIELARKKSGRKSKD